MGNKGFLRWQRIHSLVKGIQEGELLARRLMAVSFDFYMGHSLGKLVVMPTRKDNRLHQPASAQTVSSMHRLRISVCVYSTLH